MSDRTDLQKQIELKNRYLQKLKEQEAVKGVDAEPWLLIEIEDKGAELARLQAELEALEAEPATPLKRLKRLSGWQMVLLGVVGLGLLCGFGLAGGTMIYLSTRPTLIPPPPDTPIPTPLLSLPPTPTPPPLLPTPTPSQMPGALSSSTPTLEGVTFISTPNCPDPGGRIRQPDSGERVSGIVQISGAASIDNFDYYKFEFRPPGGDWNFVGRYVKPVSDGVLGTWNTANTSPGEYEFRLVVVDTIGNYSEPCVIRLVVE